MAFDTLKLDKGLYASSKGFTASLEAVDPSENYIGTELEGLDAYQRQLKRFDIKVSGAGSDSVSKFFQTSDSAVLFPEYISRAVQQGVEEADLLSKIIATTTEVDSLDYRSVESVPSEEEKELAAVGEGAFIPETTIRACEPVYKNACDAACNRKRNKAHKALAMKCKLLNTGLLAVVFHIFLKPLLGTVLLRGAGLSGPDFIADLCDSFYGVFGLAFNVIILAVFECDFHNKKLLNNHDTIFYHIAPGFTTLFLNKI